MEQILNELIESYRQDIIDTTQRLIRHPSLYEEGKEGAPFGEPIAKALEDVLGIAELMGFDTQNYDGYAGTASWGTKGKQIGVLTHIDVVPAGEGWTCQPFEGTVENGRLYGRGSLDDKGPMAASLFAMKAIKESGLPVQNHVRHIIGTDEESGFMRGLKYYLKKEKPPWGGFSPDGEFPVIHAEKGILRFHLTDQWGPVDTKKGIKIKELKGGTKVNVVPSGAYAVIGGVKLTEEVLMTYKAAFAGKDKIFFAKLDNGDWRIEAKGHSGHSSQPWNGENAINLLLEFLQTLPLVQDGCAVFAGRMAEMFGDGYKGERLGVCCEDKLSGILTLSLGVIEITETKGKATVEIRYPIHASKDMVLKTLRTACEDNKVELEIIQDKGPVYFPAKAPLVQTLLSVYKETTQRTEGPVVIGGGTYCRAAENFVAYGPVFPGQRELAHEPDEYISLDDLILSAKIYTQALYNLLSTP